MHGHKLGKLTAQISCLPSGKSKYRGIRKAKPRTLNIHCCSRQTIQECMSTINKNKNIGPLPVSRSIGPMYFRNKRKCVFNWRYSVKKHIY
jgi:hypothetical protein